MYVKAVHRTLMKLSPDASQLMTAGDDGLVCLWDIATRSLKRLVSADIQGPLMEF